MFKRDNELIYSPSDLNAFLANECVTWLDRFNLEHPGELHPDGEDEQAGLLRQVGEEHERACLQGLVDAGSDVTVIDRNDPAAFATTVEAMREGRGVIYQARLEHAGFAGWADFLVRVEGPSDVGAWHYEVWDAKLARSVKPYFAIQLCCYSEMVKTSSVFAASIGALPCRDGFGVPSQARAFSRFPNTSPARTDNEMKRAGGRTSFISVFVGVVDTMRPHHYRS